MISTTKYTKYFTYFTWTDQFQNAFSGVLTLNYSWTMTIKKKEVVIVLSLFVRLSLCFTYRGDLLPSSFSFHSSKPIINYSIIIYFINKVDSEHFSLLRVHFPRGESKFKLNVFKSIDWIGTNDGPLMMRTSICILIYRIKFNVLPNSVYCNMRTRTQ